MVKYYQVKNAQLFVMSILVGVFASAVLMINNTVKEYFQLPEVIISEGKCVTVSNYKNGDAFTCGDVGVILRNYRTKKN